MHITRVIPALTIGLVLMGGVAQAQSLDSSDTTTIMSTSSSAMTTATSTVPGTPNTGIGGEATSNMVALMVSAAVALLGGAYLMRTRHG